ncbi:MAG: PAS domain S-box protein, partial [Spirochaetia bacterium]
MITVVDVNEAARVLSEVTDRRKLLGPLERALDLEDPAKLASLRDNVLLIAEGVTHREKEARMTTPSGRTLDILVTHFLTDPGDSSSRMMVSIQDISRQKRAESDLRRSEECYRTLAENLGEGIAIVDPTETFLYANPAAEEVFGVARGRLAGMELRQFVSETDYQHFFGEAGKRQGGEASRFEQRIVRPDGTTRWIEVIATPQFDQGGTFSHTLKIFRDITDVRKNQEALRRSEEWFRRLFQGHCAIMLIIDQPTGNILDANKAAAVFYGWSVEELTRMRIQQISIQAPEAMRRAPDEAALARPGTLELAHRRADGSVRDVEVFNSSIELTGRNVNYSIIYDITERKRAEKALVENEARFRTLIEQAPVAIMVSRNRTSLFANWKCLQLLGMRTVEESIGRPIASYFAPQAPEEILERSRRRSL